MASEIKGHLNPAEFIDLIYLIGLRLRVYHPMRYFNENSNKVAPEPSRIITVVTNT